MNTILLTFAAITSFAYFYGYYYYTRCRDGGLVPE